MSHLFQPPLGTDFINQQTQQIDHRWLEWLRLLYEDTTERAVRHFKYGPEGNFRES